MGTLGKKIVVSIILGFVVLGVIVYSQNAFAQSFDLTGLKAYWKFEETSGPLKMDPISEFSTDSIVDVEMTKTFPGIIGNAWKFGTGTTEKPSPTRIEIGNADNWNFHQGHQKPGYTHNFWAKAIDNNVSPRSAVFSNGGLSGTSNNNLFVTFDYSGSHTRIWVIDRAILPNSPFSHVGVDGKLPTDDKWHMFTFTKDLSASGGSGNNFPLRFYVDGVFAQLRIFAGNTPASNYLVLGNQCGPFCTEWDGGAYENTPVDEWSVWSRVLTDSEITDLYNDGIGLELDDLDSGDEDLLSEILDEIKDIWMAIQNEVIPLLRGIDTKLDNSHTDKVVVTVNLDDIKLKTGEVMVLLDTTGSGKLSNVHVAANLPCNILGDGKPTDGDGNDEPGIWVVAGVADGMLSGVLDEAADDTGFVGPKETCVFHDTVAAADLGHDITDVIIIHPDNHPPMDDKKDKTKEHDKLEGVVVTITGTYE
jgi:hypothetical protein